MRQKEVRSTGHPLMIDGMSKSSIWKKKFRRPRKFRALISFFAFTLKDMALSQNFTKPEKLCRTRKGPLVAMKSLVRFLPYHETTKQPKSHICTSNINISLTYLIFRFSMCISYGLHQSRMGQSVNASALSLNPLDKLDESRGITSHT